MKKTVDNIIVLTFLALLPCSPALAQTPARYKVGVAYASSLYSHRESFEFSLNGSERVTLDSAHPIAYFSQQLQDGQSYQVSQLSGPRPCNLQGGQSGTIAGQDVIVNANCGYPPITLFKIQVMGVAQGETFSFKDNFNRRYSYPFSTTGNLGGYPQGDYYSITQIGGPRACKMTYAQGTVSSNTVTVIADCRKSTNTPPPAPANKYDLVTRSSDGKLTNTYYESGAPVIAGNGEDEGRYVAFEMYGQGIDGSSGKYKQVFWRDRKNGITRLVSKSQAGAEGNGNSFAPSISDDGRYVAFESYATNLSSQDNNSGRDVYLWDGTTGQVRLVSRSAGGMGANGESYEPVISGDGTTIAFTSYASDIVTLEPVFSTPNVYVYDVNGGGTIFITKDHETGKAVSGYAPSISDDGSKIAFCSFSAHLVPNDNNNLWDIFLWQKGATGLKRISLTASGGERNQGDESSSRVVWPAISGNGDYVAYATTSTNVVDNDLNKAQDIFLYHTLTGSTKRVSMLNSATEGDGDSPIGQGERIGISYEGNWISYRTNAANFGVPKGNIVLHNTRSGKVIPVTEITGGSTARPMLSKYGNYVIAGCSEKYDKRFASSGIFTIFTNAAGCVGCDQ